MIALLHFEHMFFGPSSGIMPDTIESRPGHLQQLMLSVRPMLGSDFNVCLMSGAPKYWMNAL